MELQKNRRIVVVTGATRGIGRALTARLVERGHTVIGCGRSQHAIDELTAEFDHPHRFDAVDVSDWPAVEEWAAAVLSETPPPELLMNNAGVINRNAPLWEISSEEFSEVIDINVDGTANVVRAHLTAMIERGLGVIVNMSSGWGRTTAPEVAPYCASKWAIEGLNRALAQELPAGLAAVAVNPGIIDTDMLRCCWAEDAGAFPSPDAWAERAAPFLLGLSAADNGASLTV